MGIGVVYTANASSMISKQTPDVTDSVKDGGLTRKIEHKQAEE